MNDLPCKKRKCILYPVCRNKTKIICDCLNDYYHGLRSDKYTKRYRLKKDKNEVIRPLTALDIWTKYIKSSFPNLIHLQAETEPKPKKSPYKYELPKVWKNE